MERMAMDLVLGPGAAENVKKAKKAPVVDRGLYQVN
jgi:hypothetical protein